MKLHILKVWLFAYLRLLIFFSMKQIISLLFLSAVFTSAIPANAQQQPNIGCMDKTLRLQAEQIKQDLKAQGMSVYKDAMVSMESREPFPIAVQLTKGQMYQMVFVGSKEASRLTFELYDGQDNKIDQKELDDPADANYVIYPFIPDKTDVYLVVLTQKLKSKTLCSSFCILQKLETPAKNTNTTPAKKSGNDATYPLKRGNNIKK